MGRHSAPVLSTFSTGRRLVRPARHPVIPRRTAPLPPWQLASFASSQRSFPLIPLAIQSPFASPLWPFPSSSRTKAPPVADPVLDFARHDFRDASCLAVLLSLVLPASAVSGSPRSRRSTPRLASFAPPPLPLPSDHQDGGVGTVCPFPMAGSRFQYASSPLASCTLHGRCSSRAQASLQASASPSSSPRLRFRLHDTSKMSALL